MEVDETPGLRRLLLILRRVGVAAFVLAAASGIYRSIRAHSAIPGITLALSYVPEVRSLEDRGQYQRVANQLRLALKFPSNDNATAQVTHHVMLGDALHELGCGTEAVAHYRESLRLKPDDAVVQNNLGAELVALGKYAEAVAHYEEALRLDPGYAEARSNLGGALADQGMIAEAAVHYQEALRLRPDLWQTHYNLFLVLRELGRIDEAMEHFEQSQHLQTQ